MKEWIIKENQQKPTIRLNKFGFFNSKHPIELHREYIIQDFNPISLFRHTLQEIRLGNDFWCKFLYRLNHDVDNNTTTIEFVIEDYVEDRIDVFKVFSYSLDSIPTIEFGAIISLDSRGDICRKYIVNGVSLLPVCGTYSKSFGKFYRILGPKLSEMRKSKLVIKYRDC